MTNTEIKVDNDLLYTEHLKCPNCNRKTTGEEDYLSLVKGSTKIKKTCIRCRKETYINYKNKSNKQTKTKETENIDYNKEYLEHTRCRGCNRKTSGAEDFKNIRSGKMTKTCKVCRSSVYASLKKKPRQKPPPRLTQRAKLQYYQQLIKRLNTEDLTTNLKTIDNTEFNQEVLNLLKD